MVKKKEQLPVWVWIVIVTLSISTLLLFSSYRNSVSIDDYLNLSLEYADSLKMYAELGIDYITLIDCYQRGLPTCQALIQKEGYSPLVFKQYDHGNCENDWFLIEGTDFCCPDPISEIVDGDCVRR